MVRFRQRYRVEDAALNKIDVESRQITELSSAQIIKNNHTVPAFPHSATHMGADEPGSPGNNHRTLRIHKRYIL